MNLTAEEREIIINLICDKQSEIIIQNHNNHNSKSYKTLELIKIKIKQMREEGE